MRKDYPVITQGETIVINYKDIGKRFRIDIVETKPAEIIKIIDADLDLDFDTPYDYVEPKKVSPPPKQNNYISESKQNQNYKIPQQSRNTKLDSFKKTGEFVPFSGKGYTLGSK